MEPGPARRFTVVVGDPNEHVRSAVVELLNEHLNLHIAATASTGDELVQLVTYHQPDIALFDLMVCSAGGRLDKALRAAAPDTVLAVFTARAGRRHLVDSDADAFFTKGSSENLAEAVHSLLCGTGHEQYPENANGPPRVEAGRSIDQ